MATITVRALNQNTWEPQQGNGQANFISDLQAVAQIIATRLKLFEGEWFLNLQDGLPLFQSILGTSSNPRNLQVILSLISARIQGTQYVTGITSITGSYIGRRFSFSAQVSTKFGSLTLSNTPGTAAVITSTS